MRTEKPLTETQQALRELLDLLTTSRVLYTPALVSAMQQGRTVLRRHAGSTLTHETEVTNHG